MTDAMTDVSYIGWWAFRHGIESWHLVESEITDRLVMRCGRQMKLETAAGPLIVEAAPTGRTCFFCATRGRPE